MHCHANNKISHASKLKLQKNFVLFFVNLSPSLHFRQRSRELHLRKKCKSIWSSGRKLLSVRIPFPKGRQISKPKFIRLVIDQLEAKRFSFVSCLLRNVIVLCMCYRMCIYRSIRRRCWWCRCGLLELLSS